MKRIMLFTLILMALAACTPKADMANPASVYCEQNGFKLEIRTAQDNRQSGFCVFPDGSSCDEWAYFRGECGPASPQATAEADEDGSEEENPGSSTPTASADDETGWWGVIKSTQPGSQYDDYFEQQDQGQITTYGIDARDPAVQEQMAALCDSGKVVHIFGTLDRSVPDYNGSQILVSRIEVGK